MAAEGGFEDKEVEVDLGWGGGEGGERVGCRCGLAGAGREVRYGWCGRRFGAGRRVALDHLVEARLECHAEGGGGLGLYYGRAMDEGEGLFLHVLQLVCVAIDSIVCRYVCSIVTAGRETSVASRCHMQMGLVTTLLQLQEAGSVGYVDSAPLQLSLARSPALFSSRQDLEGSLKDTTFSTSIKDEMTNQS